MSRIFARSRALCMRLERRVPAPFIASLRDVYLAVIRDELHRLGSGIVLDVGGGHLAPYVESAPPGVSFVATDILHDQLIANVQVRKRVVADATRPWPFADGSIDVVLSRSVLEHLPEQDTFVSECRRILKPGGALIAFLPCRYSPFAMLNRLLPTRVSQLLLNHLLPNPSGECGFKAYYRHCYYPRLPRLWRKHGLSVEVCRLRYYQSSYYRAVLPVYLSMLGYDLLLWKLQARLLAAQMLLVGRKTTSVPQGAAANATSSDARGQIRRLRGRDPTGTGSYAFGR